MSNYSTKLEKGDKLSGAKIPAPLKTEGFSSGFNFQNLYRAYLDCRRHKRKTYHAAKFEIKFESELLKLEEELQNHTYELGR